MKNTLLDIAIGLQLKRKRLSKKMTMQQIADKANITKQAYYYYENGKRSMTISMLVNLCECLELDYATVIKNANNIVFKG